MSGINPIYRVLMRLPNGISIKGREAEMVISEWKREKRDITNKQWDFEQLATKVEKRLVVLGKEVLDAAKEVRVAKTNFKKARSPVAKRRWARRVVIANELHKYNRGSKQQLEVMVDRVRDAIEDSKLVTKLVESRISDAEIYYQLNGRLKLVGKDLAAATREYAMPEIEYRSAEVTMEQIEHQMSGKTDDTLLLEAQTIVKLPSEEDTKDGQK